MEISVPAAIRFINSTRSGSPTRRKSCFQFNAFAHQEMDRKDFEFNSTADQEAPSPLDAIHSCRRSLIGQTREGLPAERYRSGLNDNPLVDISWSEDGENIQVGGDGVKISDVVI